MIEVLARKLPNSHPNLEVLLANRAAPLALPPLLAHLHHRQRLHRRRPVTPGNHGLGGRMILIGPDELKQYQGAAPAAFAVFDLLAWRGGRVEHPGEGVQHARGWRGVEAGLQEGAGPGDVELVADLAEAARA